MLKRRQGTEVFGPGGLDTCTPWQGAGFPRSPLAPSGFPRPPLAPNCSFSPMRVLEGSRFLPLTGKTQMKFFGPELSSSQGQSMEGERQAQHALEVQIFC